MAPANCHGRRSFSRFAVFVLILLTGFIEPSFQQADADDSDDQDGDDENTVLVRAPIGPILGSVGSVGDDDDGLSVYKFVGVPYAEPPLGSLRFRPPAPKRAWQDTLNATQFGPACPQLPVGRTSSADDADFDEESVMGEEDCLYLNIFTTRLPARSTETIQQSNLLPVIVFIHGGGYISGDSAQYLPYPLLQKDVIVVTLNYRLGVFGFLTLGNSIIAGNQALKDQLEALRFINSNIMAFGGDPNKVTLMGSAHGAIMAHLHQLSPTGSGLYRAVIAQSGTALTSPEYFRSKRSLQEGGRFVLDIGCQHLDMAQVLACLQEMSTADLLNATASAYEWGDPVGQVEASLDGNGTYYFGPAVDDYARDPFIPREPLATLQSGQQKDLPLLTGTNSNDGSVFVVAMWNQLNEVSANWTQMGPSSVFYLNPKHVDPEDQLKAGVLRQFYVGSADLDQSKKDQLTQLYTDAHFVSPAHKTLELQTRQQRSPIYYYELTHAPSQSSVTFYGVDTGAAGEDFGVAYLDDLLYQFSNFYGLDPISSSEDQSTQDHLTTLWTNFAKYADPTPFQEESLPIWEPWDPEHQTYLNLSSDPTLGHKIHEERMYLWDKIFWEDVEALGLRSPRPRTTTVLRRPQNQLGLVPRVQAQPNLIPGVQAQPQPQPRLRPIQVQTHAQVQPQPAVPAYRFYNSRTPGFVQYG